MHANAMFGNDSENRWSCFDIRALFGFKRKTNDQTPFYQSNTFYTGEVEMINVAAAAEGTNDDGQRKNPSAREVLLSLFDAFPRF
jgi:hypothetical protein